MVTEVLMYRSSDGHLHDTWQKADQHERSKAVASLLTKHAGDYDFFLEDFIKDLQRAPSQAKMLIDYIRENVPMVDPITEG